MLELGAPLRLDASAATPSGWRMIRTAATVGTGDGSSVVAAVAELGDERRLRLGLPFLDGARVVDVSIQPGVWIDHVRTVAARADARPNEWVDRVRADLVAAGDDAGWWRASALDGVDAVGVALRAAWPLLRGDPDRERTAAGSPIREVPRWAATLLHGPDVTSGARRLLGRRANRPVVRAIAELLADPEGGVDWWPLALAATAARVEGDHLVRLLRGASSEGSMRPSVDDVSLLEVTLASAAPGDVVRLTTTPDGADAAEHAHRVLVALDGWRRCGGRTSALPPSVELVERRVTSTLGDTVGQAGPTVRRRRVRTARRSVDEVAAPIVPPAEELPSLRPVAEPEPPAAPGWARPRYAPTVAPEDEVELPDRFDHPRMARRLHLLRDGDLTLRLPDGPRQLTAWGDELRNCLDTYAPAIATGRTIVLGVTLDDRLVGAVELDASLHVHQLLGSANRRLPTATERAVITLLS